MKKHQDLTMRSWRDTEPVGPGLARLMPWLMVGGLVGWLIIAGALLKGAAWYMERPYHKYQGIKTR